MITATVKLTSVSEMIASLKAAPRLIDAGNRGAMNQTLAEAKRVADKNAPVKTGQLRRGIRAKVTGAGDRLEGRLSTSRTYSADVEFGTGLYGERTGPHRIYPRTAKAMHWLSGGKGALTLAGRRRKGKAGAGAVDSFARSTRGMHPHHFMRPAAAAAGKAGPKYFKAAAVVVLQQIKRGAK